MAANNQSFSDMVNYMVYSELDTGRKFSNTQDITVNLSGLQDSQPQYASAVKALNMWTALTGLTFSIENSNENAQITVDNEELGSAYAQANYYQNTGLMTTVFVNVGKDWMDGFPSDERWDYGHYGYQTFVHEFGHALGLEHPGPYNGNGTYANDAVYTKDTYQYTVMSYFDQSEGGAGATNLFLYTPMMADIAGIRQLYNSPDVNNTDTTYGKSETALYGVTDFDNDSNATFCLYDTGGIDVLDFSNTATDNRIELRSGYFSDVNGHSKNVSIAYQTNIENTKGGSARDSILGNDFSNVIYGNAGDDSILGLGGDDKIYSGVGNDVLRGGAGSDDFCFRSITEARGDKIMDFTQGQDKINLNAMDARTQIAGNQNFTWIGTDAFSNTAGELRMLDSGNVTFVAGDVNGDGVTDFSIRVYGGVNLTASDFIL